MKLSALCLCFVATALQLVAVPAVATVPSTKGSLRGAGSDLTSTTLSTCCTATDCGAYNCIGAGTSCSIATGVNMGKCDLASGLTASRKLDDNDSDEDDNDSNDQPTARPTPTPTRKPTPAPVSTPTPQPTPAPASSPNADPNDSNDADDADDSNDADVAATTGGAACFSATSTVLVLGKGPVEMKDLNVGDQVATGKKVDNFQTVYAFAHLERTKSATFLRLHASSNGDQQSIEITGNHLVYVFGKSNPVTAASVKTGDVLQGEGDVSLQIHRIEEINRTDGIYAPLTPSGRVLVNGISASTYISLQTKDGGEEYPKAANGMELPVSYHAGIHMGLAPMRILCLGVSPSLCGNSFLNENGKPAFVDWGMRLAATIEEQHYFVQFMAFVVALALAFPLYAVEQIIGAAYLPIFLSVGVLAAVSFQRNSLSARIVLIKQQKKL